MKLQAGRGIAAMVVVAAVAGATTVIAHQGATGVVMERMEVMKTLGSSMKTISAMVRGKAPYDAEKLRRAATVIASHGGERMTALFPKGTHHGPSEATPAIWQDWKRFSAYADELRIRAEALAEAPRTEAKAAYRALGRTCGECHRSFRKEK